MSETLESLDLLYHLPAEIRDHGTPRMDWLTDDSSPEFVYAFPDGAWSAFRSEDGQRTWQRLTRWPDWAGPPPTKTLAPALVVPGSEADPVAPPARAGATGKVSQSIPPGSPLVAAGGSVEAEPAGPVPTVQATLAQPGPAGEALPHEDDGDWPLPGEARANGIRVMLNGLMQNCHTDAWDCHDQTCTRPRPHTADVCTDPELSLAAAADRVRAGAPLPEPTPAQLAHVQAAAESVLRNTLRKACADLGHHVHGQCDDAGQPICARCATPHYGAVDGLEWRAPSDPSDTTRSSASRRRGGPRQTRRARG